jgi:hypothetical protein
MSWLTYFTAPRDDSRGCDKVGEARERAADMGARQGLRWVGIVGHIHPIMTEDHRYSSVPMAAISQSDGVIFAQDQQLNRFWHVVVVGAYELVWNTGSFMINPCSTSSCIMYKTARASIDSRRVVTRGRSSLFENDI